MLVQFLEVLVWLQGLFQVGFMVEWKEELIQLEEGAFVSAGLGSMCWWKVVFQLESSWQFED